MSITPKPPLVHYQPFRLIYRIAKIAVALAQLPIWVTCASVPGLRPDRKWTFAQTMMVKLLRAGLDLNGSVGCSEDRPLDKDRKGELVVVATIEPFAPEEYTGPLVSPSIKPSAIHGNAWLPGPPGDSKINAKMAMLIHGGAFVLDSGAAKSTGFAAKALLNQLHADHVFNVRYRLSGYQGRNTYPAAPQDVLTSYLYLVRTLKIDPSNIIVVGDSAGGNLVVFLLRYIEIYGRDLGISAPGHALLLSPWVSPCSCFHEPGETKMEHHAKYQTDYLPVSLLRYGATVYSPGGPDSGRKNHWITPLGHPFKTSVPIFVNIGSDEVLGPDIAVWAEEMRALADDSGSIEVHYQANGPHDTFLGGEAIYFQESNAKMLERAASFIEMH